MVINPGWMGLDPARRLRRAGGLILLAVLLLGTGACTQWLHPKASPAACAPKPRPLDQVVARLPHANVSGQVLDKDGKPLPGAELFLYYQRGKDGLRDRLVAKTRSDAKGAFKFRKALVWEPLPETRIDSSANKYVILGRHPAQGINFTVILPGDRSDQVTVRLRGVLNHDLEAVDINGKPIEGVKFYLYSGTGNYGSGGGERERFILRSDIGLSNGQTDKQGKVRLMGPAGAYFYAEKDGLIRIEGNQKMTLFPAAQVSGKVTYADGRPAAGAAVWFEYKGKAANASEVALTDKQGHYSFKNLPCAGYRFQWMDAHAEDGAEGNVTLQADDLRPGSNLLGKTENLTLKPGDMLVRNLTLARGAVLSGKVIDITTGQPVPRMQMMCFMNNGYGQTLFADDNGEFRLRLTPGTKLEVQPSTRNVNYVVDKEWQQQGNYQLFSGKIDKDMPNQAFKVKLWKASPLSGRVVNEKGAGVQSALVFVYEDVPPAATDASGAFTLPVGPDERDFDLYAVNFDKTLVGIGHFKAGTKSVSLKLASVRDFAGQACDADGLACSNLKFNLVLHLNESSIYHDAVRHEVQAGADGKFSVPLLCPQAAYYAYWSGDNDVNRDYDYGNATIDLAKLKPGEPLRFEAPRYVNALMGKVVNEKGEPVAGATIQIKSHELLPQEMRSYNQKLIATDKSGEFTVSRLAAGQAELEVLADGYKTRTFKSRSDAVDAQVVLGPVSAPSTYKIKVVGEAGRPAAGVAVHFRRKVPEQSGVVEQNRELTTDAAGECVLTLPPLSKDDRRRIDGLIGCSVDGFCHAYENLNPPEDREILFTLEKADNPWTGRVIDSGQKPITDAQVRVSSLYRGNESGWRIQANLPADPRFTFRTDADGRFALAGFNCKAIMQLKITAPGMAEENFMVRPGTKPGRDIQLLPNAALKGKVVIKGTNQPLTTGRVMVYSMGGGGGYNGDIKLGPDGTFLVSSIKPGANHVQVSSHEGKIYMSEDNLTVNVEPGRTTEMTIVVDEAIPLAGRLVDAKTGKQPEGQLWLVIEKEDDRSRNYRGFSGDGRWSAELLEGSYTISYCVGQPNSDLKEIKKIKLERGKKYEEIVVRMP